MNITEKQNFYLKFLQEAISDARNSACTGEMSLEQIADLLDAIHNIPEWITFDSLDDEMIQAFFSRYEEEWNNTKLNDIKQNLEARKTEFGVIWPSEIKQHMKKQ